MLVDELKKANIEALKAHDEQSRNILGVVLNKVKLCEISKRTTNESLVDADVVNVLQKTAKELVEEKEGYDKMNNTVRSNEISQQMAVVERFLPKMMTEEEIKAVINTLSDKSIPSVMRHFKENYAGKCDMKVVSTLAKQ